MQQASSHNTDAFVELMTAHQGRLYAYILTLLGDPDQANDVLQEANMVLWRNAAEYRPGVDIAGRNLIDRADKALYASKQSGANRVTAAGAA